MNSTTTIKATCVETGQEYDLVLYQRTSDKGIMTTLLNGTGTRTYKSLNEFLKHWKNISKL